MKKIKIHIRFTLTLMLLLFCVYQGANAYPQFLEGLFPVRDLPAPASILPDLMSVQINAQRGQGSRARMPFQGWAYRKNASSEPYSGTGPSSLQVLHERPVQLPSSFAKKAPHRPEKEVRIHFNAEAAARPPSYPSRLPKDHVARIVQAIENKFDKEKYDAFKAFSEEEKAKEEDKARSGPLTEKMKVVQIQRGLNVYQEALAGASRKAEQRRVHLVRYLQRVMAVSVIAKEDAPYARMLISSFLNVMTPGTGPFVFEIVENITAYHAHISVDLKNLEKTRLFLERNLTMGGLPLSYQATKEYWQKLKNPMDRVDSVLERVIVKYSVNIYDSAVWQIALSVFGSEKSSELVDAHTHRMISGTSGRMRDIRAYGLEFKYGEKKKVLKKDNAFFFRIIADEYIQPDPLGENEMDGYPNFKTVHHEDWKPIAGEQAWAAIIGPVQVAYEKYGKDIPLECPEIQLALSILPAVQAMQSGIGAIYHAPAGTHGKNPHDISNENNFSMYAALRMLYPVVERKDRHLAEAVKGLLQKQERYFKNYAFDFKEGIFYQGGFYVDGEFIPTKIFAVDCQTWGIAALGVEKIDNMFGAGAAYRIWKNTVRRSGHFDEQGVLRGVGFTDDHRVLSVEWTCGAILAARKIAEAYRRSNPVWASECAMDAVTMRQGVEKVKTDLPDGSVAYLYANNRYFIPFGWWANPLPSLVSSAWIILTDLQYDPFILGGGPHFSRPR